ncbi:MAG: methyltransferase, partial [Pseudomonadota bacterium]
MVSLNLFQRLADGPLDTDTLARELDMPPHSVTVLMSAAHAL